MVKKYDFSSKIFYNIEWNSVKCTFYKLWQEYCKIQVKFLKNKEVDFFGLQLAPVPY